MPSSTPMHFVGREYELTALEAMLDSALSGCARIALLTGEPGIGKTAIARVFADTAAERGALVLWGRCHDQPGAPAYWPWVQILRGFAHAQDDEGLRSALGAGLGCIAEIFPELAERMPVTSPQPRADAAQARFRLFDAIGAMWQRAAAAAPLLLIFEDLHWGDAASLRLLEFVASVTATSRLLILATFRDSDMAGEHPLLATVGELQRNLVVQRLPLTGLRHAETGRLLQAQTGRVPSTAVVHFAQTKTVGNPLFVAELARYLARGGWLSTVPPAGEWRVPDGIRAFMANRLSGLSPATKHVMQLAAAIGTRFSLRLLHATIDDGLEDGVATALEEALAERVVECTSEPGCYTFAHVLTRDTLYEELPALDRARLHERVAVALEADHRDHLAPHLAALAYHFSAAMPVGSSAKAIAYANAAGEQARTRLAYEEASRCFSLALGLLDHTAAPNPELRCKLLIALAGVQMKSGHTVQALNALTEAAGHARHLGAADQLAEAAIEFEEAAWRLGLPGIRAVGLLEQSLEHCGENHRVMRARLQSSLARALAFAGSAERADRLQRETVQLARQVGDLHTLEAALRSRFWLPWNPADLEALLAIAHETIALAAQLGSQERVLDATAFRLHLLIAVGDVQGFAADLLRFAQLASELQQPFHQYHSLAMRAAQALMSGRFVDADVLARRALELGKRLPGLDASGAYGMQRFSIARERGELAPLAPLVQHFVRATPSVATWRPALALILAELGEIAAANAQLQALAPNNFQAVARDSLWLASVAYLAEVCALVRDRAHAVTLHALLAPWSGRNVVAGSVVVCYGPVDRFLGMLCTLLERWDDAERHFNAALDMNVRQGSMPWLAHAQHDYAAMLVERNHTGDRQRAHALMNSAKRWSEDIRMAALQTRLTQLEQRVDPGPQMAPHAAGLSRREAQVLRMLAAGKSNRQIAAAIFRSPNTVANHVRSILAKLGAANRTEAASFAARHGLL